jgi:hypothetical protein
MNLENFFEDDVKPAWGTHVEKEIRRRIKLSIAAYAYEFEDDSIISDAEFDSICLEVQPKLMTGNGKMDRFFLNHFDPSTGQWIRKHPEVHRIKELYYKYYKR